MGLVIFYASYYKQIKCRSTIPSSKSQRILFLNRLDARDVRSGVDSEWSGKLQFNSHGIEAWPTNSGASFLLCKHRGKSAADNGNELWAYPTQTTVLTKDARTEKAKSCFQPFSLVVGHRMET